MTLDEAFAEAEAALPEGWSLTFAENHGSQGWEFGARGRTTLRRNPPQLDVQLERGKGPTLAAALHALAEALRAADQEERL